MICFFCVAGAATANRKAGDLLAGPAKHGVRLMLWPSPLIVKLNRVLNPLRRYPVDVVSPLLFLH